MTIRTSQREIRELLSAADNAKTGRVMYPTRTFDGDLLESMAHDLQDHFEIETRLDSAIALADQRGDTEIAKTLRWIQEGNHDDTPRSA